MITNNYADELEKEIVLMEQEIIFKRTLLEECRQKLNSEISEHALTKSTANKYLNENRELKMQLEVCVTGTKKLEEENNRSRELFVQLQVQMKAHLNERQELLDKCFQAEKENETLKNEVKELKEQLRGHLSFMNNFTQRNAKTEAILNEIITKQGLLNKEQTRLETACKEGMQFAEKLSEEAKFQTKFIKEAAIGQKQLETQIIRLMAVIRELQAEREKHKNETHNSDTVNYLEEWKIEHKEMKVRNEELQEINRKLTEELNITKEQVEILLRNYSKEASGNVD